MDHNVILLFRTTESVDASSDSGSVSIVDDGDDVEVAPVAAITKASHRCIRDFQTRLQAYSTAVVASSER